VLDDFKTELNRLSDLNLDYEMSLGSSVQQPVPAKIRQDDQLHMEHAATARGEAEGSRLADNGGREEIR